MGYCNYFNCFCDDDRIEKEQDETGEYCDVECKNCEWYEE